MYKAEIIDNLFNFYHVFAELDMKSLDNYQDLDAETLQAILSESESFAQKFIEPINRSGDEQGAMLKNIDGENRVFAPNGFKEAYRAYCKSGWLGLSMDTEYGGQGLGKSIYFMVDEMFAACNSSFWLYGNLTAGAISALGQYLPQNLRDLAMPRIVNGDWTATMCLTEPHAGTDLGILRTKARALGNGDEFGAKYALTGTKIFITGGDHDLSDNIMHFVIARLEDAPKGVKGISLFMVPKYRFDGTKNGVETIAVENKMGIKGSATCALSFDNAHGWLVGAENQGLSFMFLLMNQERISVGVQALGCLNYAYQRALTYSQERLQSRAPDGIKMPDKEADPIYYQPDVKRMLNIINCWQVGLRALAIKSAMHLDLSRAPNANPMHGEIAQLLTPIVKAFISDRALDGTILAQQIFGGHGYIREHGMEQIVRDARIAQIYEGANGVQAMDLVRRKLGYFSLLEDEVLEFLNICPIPYRDSLSRAWQALAQTVAYVQQLKDHEKMDYGYELMTMFGYGLVGYLLAKQVHCAKDCNAPLFSKDFLADKSQTADFYFKRLLPQIHSLAAAINGK